jgi:asparagine synthase (glutamine-hydrolysing)
MCGIWAVLSKEPLEQTYGSPCYDSFKKIANRGPDRSIFVEYRNPLNIILGFHRLSIMDLSLNGDQPFVHEHTDSDGNMHNIAVICNGEIYNHEELVTEYGLKLRSKSDCEIIHLLYCQIGIDALMKRILGEFAFIIVDMVPSQDDVKIYAARDPFGVRPLFVSLTSPYINFSSEIKGLLPNFDQCLDESRTVAPFKPGHYAIVDKFLSMKYVQYYSCRHDPCLSHDNVNLKQIKVDIVDKLTEAVRCRLVSDRPLGCLLSGGLDSSLVASIAAKFLREKNKKLRTFSIGIGTDSTDEKFAKLVSEHIGSIHTHVSFSQDQFIDSLHEVIKATETYDITTVRASAGQYLISKWIATNTDIKVLLVGDGSDEICSGYLYFHQAPDAMSCHYENIRLLEDISCYDVLRVDRGIANNGLEARVPFLDIRFVDYYLQINPEYRKPTGGIEKWLLRESFKDTKYLPDVVLWRKKEAMSDGISSNKKSWFEIIQEYVNNLYSNTQLEERRKEYRHNPPVSKESLYFRDIFEMYFGKDCDQVIPYYWLPKWCGNTSEPSARALNIYKTEPDDTKLCILHQG